MKKSKILLSTLAAAVFATSAGALVACGDGVELPPGLGDKTYTITFDANEGTLKGNPTITIDANTDLTTISVPTADRKDYTFKGWTYTKNGNDELEIKFDPSVDSITVYAKWEKKTVVETPTSKEYKIKFDKGNHGNLEGDLEVTTVKGLAKFPKVTADKDWEPNGWKDEDGKTVDESTVFTKDITVTAQYKEVEQGHETPDEEYTITFNEGMHGSLDGKTEVTTVKGIAEFPTPEPDDGWIFDHWEDEDGETVDESTVFTKHNVVTAYYEKDEEEEPDNVDPNPPARVHTSATINDEEMDDTTSTIDRTWAEYPNWEGYQNHTLADQFEISFSIEEETTYTFKADGTALSGMWMEHGDGLQFKIDGVIIENGNGSSLTLAAGSYSIYLKYYNNDGGSWCVWVDGSQDEDFEGGEDVRPTTDPNPPASTVAAATINDDAMDRATIDRNWKADSTHEDGGYYNNHTMTDQFKAEFTIEEETTYTFKADGTAITGMYIEYANGLEIKIDGTIATGKKNGNSITLAPGEYTVYLKKYKSDGDFCLWVQGTKTGEWDNGGGGGGEEDTHVRVYKDATVNVNNETMTDTTATVTDDANLHDQFYQQITLTEQTDVTFTVNGTQISSMWIEHGAGIQVKAKGVLIPAKVNDGDGARSDKFTLAAGTYQIYLKNYSASTSSANWVVWVQGTQTGEFETTPVGQYDYYYMVGSSARLGLAWDLLGAYDSSKDDIFFKTTDGVTYELNDVELDQNVKFKLWVAGKGYEGEVGSSALPNGETNLVADGSDIKVANSGKYNLTYNTTTKKLTAERVGDVSAVSMKFDLYIHGSYTMMWESRTIKTGVAGGTEVAVDITLEAGLKFTFKAVSGSAEVWWVKENLGNKNQTNGGIKATGDDIECVTGGTYRFVFVLSDTGSITIKSVSVVTE